VKLEWKYAKDLVSGDLIAYPYSVSETRLATVITAPKPMSALSDQVYMKINPGGTWPVSANAAVHVYRTTP